MNDQQLLRYSRHLLLPQLDLAGQTALLALQNLPPAIKVYRPLVRTLSRLRVEAYPERAPT